jgi:hypothetical protein
MSEPPSSAARASLRDERGLVARTIILGVAALVLLAVAALDTVSILSARYRAKDAADRAAEETAYAFKQTPDVRSACDTAVETVAQTDAAARIPKGGCVIDPRTGEVAITVRRTANTIVAKRIEALEEYTRAAARSTASPPP